MSEHGMEPTRGLPERLPEGERILWQGAPRWTALARRALHIRKVGLYFAALLALNAASELSGGAPPMEAALSALRLAPIALVAIGLLALYAWLIGRTTVYTITNRRIVMRFGVALPLALNIPFRIIGSAAVKLHADGTGDLPFVLTGDGRMGYLHLWPHAKPWRLKRPEPMLRAVPDAGRVAALLAEVLGAASQTGAEEARDAAPVFVPAPLEAAA